MPFAECEKTSCGTWRFQAPTRPLPQPLDRRPERATALDHRRANPIWPTLAIICNAGAIMDLPHIETGLMARLITHDICRIVSVDECGVKVETTMGLAYISPRWVVSTYEPREAFGESIRVVDDRGVYQ